MGWSAILSFGASRVFTVDGVPILLGEGDLLVLGTQRHGVPKMPAVTEGRVSVAIFWFPEHKRDDSGPNSVCSQCGRQTDLLQESEDGNFYCEACWLEWQQGDAAGASVAAAEDDLLEAVLARSLTDF